jgi:hypothetical protein
MVHGVTQSLLQRFKGDKDRFHKHAVLGLRETNRKEAMEYGSIFHKLIELGAIMGKGYTRVKMLTVMNEWIKRKYDNPESLMLVKIAIAVYEEYRVWEAKKPKREYIEAEPVFCESFEVPSHFVDE